MTECILTSFTSFRHGILLKHRSAKREPKLPKEMMMKVAVARVEREKKERKGKKERKEKRNNSVLSLFYYILTIVLYQNYYRIIIKFV